MYILNKPLNVSYAVYIKMNVSSPGLFILLELDIQRRSRCRPKHALLALIKLSIFTTIIQQNDKSTN